MSVAPETPHLLTAAEVATILKMSVRTIRRWTDDGRLPVIRFGRSVRIRLVDLEAMTGDDKTRQNPRKPMARE